MQPPTPSSARQRTVSRSWPADRPSAGFAPFPSERDNKHGGESKYGPSEGRDRFHLHLDGDPDGVIVCLCRRVRNVDKKNLTPTLYFGPLQVRLPSFAEQNFPSASFPAVR